MRVIVAVALLGIVVTDGAAGPAHAAGCLKGATVGGVAGHMAGHHGTLGAAAGCAVGHHEAAKREQQDQQAQRSNDHNDTGQASH
jgi:hypothetical protein